MRKLNNTIARQKKSLSQSEIKKFKEWLKYLIIVNNKPSNKQELFNYFFDEFGSSPQIFFLFLGYFRQYLLELKNKKEQANLSSKYLEILAPLCEYFNFFEEKNSLNEVCFKLSDPPKYSELKKLLSKYGENSEKIMTLIVDKLNKVLQKKGCDYELIGRFKNLYSIHKKMQQQPNYLIKMNDIFGFRIILNRNSSQECFDVLNELHNNFYPLPEYFRDYITIPKINGYQSLHTRLEKVVHQLDLPIEIQIRTREMDDFAEKGLAAHWLYSQEKKSQLITEKEKKLLDYFECTTRSSKKENFVYCFTYKGDILKIWKNSTVLDFAYQIHTELGNKAKYALINNNLKKPLYYRIKEGDVIKIIQSEKNEVEPKWLNYTHNKYTHKKILEYLKKP